MNSYIFFFQLLELIIHRSKANEGSLRNMLAALTSKTQIFSTTLECLIYFLFGIKFRFSVFLLFLDNDWIYKCPALSGNMVKPYKRKPRWGKSLSPAFGYGCVDVKMWKKLTWHRSLKSNILLQSAVQRREYFVLRHCQTKEQTNLTYSCERSLHLSMK